MVEVVVREARPDEYDEVGKLAVAAYRTLPDASVSGSYEPSLRDVAGRARSSVVLVATLDGRLVGTATYVPGPGPLEELTDPDAASIRMVGVRPDVRGRGVGRALIQACIAEARRAGRRRIRLSTRTVMTAAQGMYEDLGFRREPADDWSPTGDIHLLGYVLELGEGAPAGTPGNRGVRSTPDA